MLGLSGARQMRGCRTPLSWHSLEQSPGVCPVHLQWGSLGALVPRHVPALLLLLWSRVGRL